MTDPNVTIVSDLRCLHFPRLLENYARAAEPLPTSDGDLEHLFHITSIERLQALTIDDIKKEIQMIMWAHYEVDVCRKDFVLLLDTVRTAANDDSKNQLVKVDHCDSVATVLRQWEMPCGTAAEGVRIRFDPCWKNYVQLTSCTWRPFARPLRHQWKSLRAWPAIKPCVCDENLLVWNFRGCKVRWMHSNINSRVVVDGITLSWCHVLLAWMFTDLLDSTLARWSFTVCVFVVFVVFVVCVCLLCLLSVCVWLLRVVCVVCVSVCVAGVGLVCWWCGVAEKLWEECWQHWCKKMSGIKVFLTLLVSTLTSNISFIQLSSFDCLQCFRDIRRLVPVLKSLKKYFPAPWTFPAFKRCFFYLGFSQHLNKIFSSVQRVVFQYLTFPQAFRRGVKHRIVIVVLVAVVGTVKMVVVVVDVVVCSCSCC